ncbi:TetR/AcrR family transcriptional regulator [Spirochaeta dissipatitropha]
MLTKETRHQEIRDINHLSLLDAAERIFLQHGIASASLQMIAEEAGLSRVTLYKHFRGKDELVFAIETRIISEFERGAQEASNFEGSGFDRITAKIGAWTDYFMQNKAHFAFVGLFDHHYAVSYPNEELARQYRQVLTGFTHTQQLLESGIEDGSIRAGINPKEMALFIGNVFIATANRIASREEILSREQEMNPDRMIQMYKDMLLQSLQARKE